MKKLNKNSILVACLSLSLVAAAAGALTVNTQAASAESTMAMEKGASLYLKEVSGLKFSFKDSNYDAQASYGMVIVANDMLEAAQAALASETITGVAADDYVNLIKKAQEKHVFDENDKPIFATVAPDDKGVFSHSVGNLNEYNYVREFIGIGYKVTGENTYEYATLNDNVRSVFEVANLALNCHVYDEGEFDGEAGLSQEEKDEYIKIAGSKTSLENYLTKGFAFVYGEATPTASLDATYIGGEITPNVTLTALEGKDHIQPNIHWNYAAEEGDELVELTAEGKLKGVARGQGTVNAGIGGLIEVPATATVLKDATEFQIYNDSENAYLLKDVNAPVVDGTYTAQLKGGYWTDGGATDGYSDPGYLAIKNPASEDGKYTVGASGSIYVDFYFKGNNMPTVEFLGTTIENLSLGKGGDTTNTKNAPTGYVVFNGAARSETYEKWDIMQNAGKDITNFVTFNADGTVAEVLKGIETHSNYRWGGLVTRPYFFMYGMSDYGTTANNFTRARHNANGTSTSSGKGFLRHFDQGETMSMLYNEKSDESLWALKDVANCSKFSMYSLMNQGENQYWHYKVGIKLSSKGAPSLSATLYKTDANGNHVDADTSTPDTVDAFATYTKKSNCGSMTAASSGRSGYVVVYGALKGNSSNTGDRYNTQIAYKLPY